MQTPSAGTLLSGITNVVTLTITDNSGNSEQVNFNVEVSDNEDPIITSIHIDQYIDANTNCEAVLQDYISDVTAIDNCDTILNVIQSPVAGTTISGMTNVVTITVTDNSGNSAFP